MQLAIGDRITYELETGDAESVEGKIIAFSENRIDIVTTYLAQLVTGEYIKITQDNLNRCKLDEPVLKHQLIRTSPILLPVVLKDSRSLYSYKEEDTYSPFDLVVGVS
jgi:multidrug resistance efflux pump